MIDYDVEDALYYGALHYNEGMGYTDPADREKRIACFQAAEVLYRSTAEKGSADAYLCLGYVYSYDRCEGRYWRDPMVFAVDDCGAYPREKRAFECFGANSLPHHSHFLTPRASARRAVTWAIDTRCQ